MWGIPPLRRVCLLGLVASALSVICFASPAAAAGACMTAPRGGGDWPSYGHDATNTRTQPEASGLGESYRGQPGRNNVPALWDRVPAPVIKCRRRLL